MCPNCCSSWPTFINRNQDSMPENPEDAESRGEEYKSGHGTVW